MTCDGRLFHRRAAATGNALSPTVADEYVERPETLMRLNVIVVWIQNFRLCGGVSPKLRKSPSPKSFNLV